MLITINAVLPIHVYDTTTGPPAAVLLRPGKTPSGQEIVGHTCADWCGASAGIRLTICLRYCQTVVKSSFAETTSHRGFFGMAWVSQILSTCEAM
jgi:hypothetical protein